MEFLQSIPEYWLELTGTSQLWRIAGAFLLVLVVLSLRRLVTGVILRRLMRLAARTRLRYDDEIIAAVTPTIGGLFLVLGVYLATRLLVLPTEPVDIAAWVDNALLVAAALLVVYGFHRLAYVAADALDSVVSRSDPALRGQFRVVLRQLLSVAIWIVGVLVIVQNLGYSITSVLAGLGIGGLAIAFAAQETIANFFGSIMLLTDRPFRVGDWIQVDEFIDGDVEEIGFRSTKIRAWDKSLISIPNKELAAKVIKNWSRMPKRRVKQVIGVTYDTRPEQMEQLVQGITSILEQDEGVNQDFIMVKFTDFSAYSLDLLVYYFTADTAWKKHLATRERINLKIMRKVEALGLEFAFPTRTVHLTDREPA
jgi:MscS family membrane protein